MSIAAAVRGASARLSAAPFPLSAAAGGPVPCRLCPAFHGAPCRGFTAAEGEAARLPFSWPAGRTLFCQGDDWDHVLFIRDGWVQIYRQFPDGQRLILRFVLPGEPVGLESDGGAMPYTAETVTVVTGCLIGRAGFSDACARSPELARRVAALAMRETLVAWDHLCSVGRQDARGRIAALLLDLHRRLAPPGRPALPEGVPVRVPLTQTHIADATGLTSVHVSRTLKRMRQERLLDFHKGELVILDSARLGALAQPDAPSVTLTPR